MRIVIEYHGSCYYRCRTLFRAEYTSYHTSCLLEVKLCIEFVALYLIYVLSFYFFNCQHDFWVPKCFLSSRALSAYYSMNISKKPWVFWAQVLKIIILTSNYLNNVHSFLARSVYIHTHMKKDLSKRSLCHDFVSKIWKTLLCRFDQNILPNVVHFTFSKI